VLLARGREFGEAVIVHELIHLKIRNHGRLFRSLLRAYVPHAETLLNDEVFWKDLNLNSKK
jgi:predicted metal-dependent hydrolase